MVKKDEPIVGTEYTRWVYRNILVDENGNPMSVQYPSSADGDSVYAKDIDIEYSDTTGWTNSITSLVDDLHSTFENTSTDNPKVFLMHFKRTIHAHQVGLGCTGDNNFSNVKIELLGSGPEIRTVVDDINNNTKYNSRNYEFEPQLFNAVRMSFYTPDPVCLSNMTTQKATSTDSFIKIQKPDKTITFAQGTTKGNIKVSVEEANEADPTFGYGINDIDESNSPVFYYGFENKEGKWYILKEDKTISTNPTYRYSKGTTDYSTNWTNRSSLTYGTFNNTF